MSFPHVFLTGATGFIGRRLVQALQLRGCRVTALVRQPQSPEARALAARGVRLEPGDVTDRASMRLPMAEADIVVHAAGVYEIGAVGTERERVTAVNVRGTDHVLSLAHELRRPRVLQLCSALALGDTGGRPRDESFVRQSAPRSHYEWSQVQAHALAQRWRERGLPVMLACPNLVVGANDHAALGYLLRLYLNGWMPAWAGGLSHRVAPVWVDDLAHGLAQAALHGTPGDTWLFSGEAQSYRELFAQWARLPGGARRVWEPPLPLAWLLMGPAGSLLRALGLPAFLGTEWLRTCGMDLDYRAAHAQRSLGWQTTPSAWVWDQIGREEARLQQARQDRRLRARLRPVPGLA